MKTYCVTIPIAGHASVDVEANNEEDAIKEALEMVSMDHIDTWEAIMRFNQGNICYCPQPWEAEAVCVDDGEDT